MTKKEFSDDQDRIREMQKVISHLKLTLENNVRVSVLSASGLILLLQTKPDSEDRGKIIGYLQDTIRDIDVHTRYVMTTLVKLEDSFQPEK